MNKHKKNHTHVATVALWHVEVQTHGNKFMQLVVKFEFIAESSMNTSTAVWYVRVYEREGRWKGISAYAAWPITCWCSPKLCADIEFRAHLKWHMEIIYMCGGEESLKSFPCALWKIYDEILIGKHTVKVHSIKYECQPHKATEKQGTDIEQSNASSQIYWKCSTTKPTSAQLMHL